MHEKYEFTASKLKELVKAAAETGYEAGQNAQHPQRLKRHSSH